MALEALIEKPKISLSEDKIFKLMYQVDEYIPVLQRVTELPLLLALEDVFSITICRAVAADCVERRIVKLDSTVELVGLRETRTTGLQMFQKLLDEALLGDDVDLLLCGQQAD